MVAGGSTRLPMASADRISNGQLIGEEDGADHKLTRAAAAGDAAHGDGGEYRHDDGQNGLFRREVQPEHAEEECDLDDGRTWPSRPVHGGTHGQDNVGDILGNAGLIRDLHVGRDSRNGRARAKGNGCRTEQLGEHDLRAALTAAELGVDGEEDEHVGKAHDVVDDERAAVIRDQLRTVGGDQGRQKSRRSRWGHSR